MASNAASNKSIIPPTLNEPLATAPPTGTFSTLAQSPYPAWSTSALLYEHSSGHSHHSIHTNLT